ncbi:MAG: hypothetical protein ACOYLO_09735, partial [Ferruginibacter sp.]
MKSGIKKFELYFNTLDALLSKAAAQKNPGLWLYRNNARTPLFMLEGLAKLYGGMYDSKKMGKIKAHFKLLEDTLGTIDYYDAAATTLKTNKKIPSTIIKYFEAQMREKIQQLNEILIEEEWIGSEKSRAQKIKKKLSKFEWKSEADEVQLMNNFMGESIYEIAEFVQSTALKFDHIETDVHELRRKLRWLSIYAQAVDGAIQLGQKGNKKLPDYLKPYLTKAVINSPFNKMPDPKTATFVLLLDKNHFFALSWMIAELGQLKDKGLQLVAIEEALIETQAFTKEKATEAAQKYFGKKDPSIEEL